MGLAEACAESALLELAKDINYVGNETLTINSETCDILPIESLAGQKIIKARSIVNSSTSNIKITADDTTLNVIAWEEVAGF